MFFEKLGRSLYRLTDALTVSEEIVLSEVLQLHSFFLSQKSGLEAIYLTWKKGFL